MQIVVNHMTRMRHPAICVAGIDPTTGHHVRPITRGGLNRDSLLENGGPFGLGAVVELGPTRPNPDPPETEDHWFWPDRARRVDQLTADDYWDLLNAHRSLTLGACFGSALVRHKWKYAVDLGQGDRSLAILPAPRGCRLEIDRYDKVTLRMPADDKPGFVPVTDLRFYAEDQAALRTDVIDKTDEAIRSDGAVLMLGLARPFQAQGDDAKRHWLQVNGICLRSGPLTLPG